MITYSELLETISRKDITRILVFGPPRSGTTFSAYAIHKDTGFELIPEETGNRIDTKSVLRKFQAENNFVLHANRAINYFYKVAAANSAVVMLRRNEVEVIASAQRLNKLGEFNGAYGGLGGSNYVQGFMREWHSKKPANGKFFLLNYESLRGSKYWLDKGERKGFARKQVSKKHRFFMDEFGSAYKERHTKMLPPSDKALITKWEKDAC
jgi:hypothetical protein